MSHSTTVDFGTPSPQFAAEAWTTTEVRVHDFAELPAMRGQHRYSPEFTCFGRQWRLCIFPGGGFSSDEGMVSIFVQNLSQERLKIRLGLGIKNAEYREMRDHYVYEVKEFFPRRSGIAKSGWGTSNFILRSTLLNNLVEGALIIHVMMKLAEPKYEPPRPFVAENPLCTAMLKLFMHEESADIAFEVGGKKLKGNAKKRAKTSSANRTTFYAHSLILKNCASQLAEMCGSGGKDAPVPIIDVKPEIFRHLLYYIYGGKVPEDDMKLHAKGIIEAADKYGVPNLKLEAEASYVNTTTITVDNVMDNLLYADSKNCALLKEVVIDFIVENKFEVLQKGSLKDAPASSNMWNDVLVAMARCDKKNESNDGDTDQFSTMRISDLRRKAQERGLNVDGSREALIATLKNDPRES